MGCHQEVIFSMKVLNFGSLNIDLVYRVPAIVRPGETIAASEFKRFPGGKGLNQSIALARAGVSVFHAGMIGNDGLFLKELLEQEKVDCSLLKISSDLPSGSAFIQVADDGENSIVLSGGANRGIDPDYIAQVFTHFEPGDILVLQNEISAMETIMRLGAERGMRIFFNPAPMTPDVAELPLELVDTLILNDTERETLFAMSPARIKHCNLLLTHGKRGASYQAADSDAILSVPAYPLSDVADTTAAGDTFSGYFISGLIAGDTVENAMKLAAKAAAITCSRPGAAPSIPCKAEVAES